VVALAPIRDDDGAMTDHPTLPGPPGPPAHSRAALLLAAGRAVERTLERGLAGHGLTLRQVGVLGHLRRSSDLSYSELARRSDVSVQAMHVTVGRLVERGLVTAEQSPGVRAQLRVTDAGREALAVFHELLAGIELDLDDVDLDLGELLVAVRVLGGPGS
jgi:DNA-binding MarR family transcriptional regulator